MDYCLGLGKNRRGNLYDHAEHDSILYNGMTEKAVRGPIAVHIGLGIFTALQCSQDFVHLRENTGQCFSYYIKVRSLEHGKEGVIGIHDPSIGVYEQDCLRDIEVHDRIFQVSHSRVNVHQMIMFHIIHSPYYRHFMTGKPAQGEDDELAHTAIVLK